MCEGSSVLFRCHHGAAQELHTGLPVSTRNSAPGGRVGRKISMHEVMAAMEMTVYVFRMACVSTCPTVAAMLIGSNTSQETLSLSTAETGRDRLQFMVF